MITHLELDEAEAATVLYGMHQTEWLGLAASIMGIPENMIANVTMAVENGTHYLVVTEY